MRVYRDDQKFLTVRMNALLWAIVIGVQTEEYRNLSEADRARTWEGQ